MLKDVLQIYLVGILYGKITSGQQLSASYGWSTQLLLSHTSAAALKTNEPGFDFTDEEMKKLKLWPYGIVSYYIDDLSFDKVLRDRIRSYLDIFSGITGVHFMELPTPPLKPEDRWVFFVNRRGLLGCADHDYRNFTTEGLQKVILGYDCIRNAGELGVVALAIVGVPPQHNAPNRDEYITVNNDKIVPGKEYLFQKLDDKEWLFHEVEYDFSSLGHFHYHKHSVDGSATISPKVHVAKNIHVGEGDGLSYSDVMKVRMLYNYISKKKHGNVKAPECNKLLKKKKGAKLPKNDVPDLGMPRTKPNKYLGLPDNQIKESLLKSQEKDNEVDKQTQDPKNDENGDQNYNDEDENGAEPNVENENDMETVRHDLDRYQNNNDNMDTNNESPEKLKLKGHTLSVLAKYKSDDDKYHHMAALNKARFLSSTSKSARFAPIHFGSSSKSARFGPILLSSSSKPVRFVPANRPRILTPSLYLENKNKFLPSRSLNDLISTFNYNRLTSTPMEYHYAKLEQINGIHK